MKGIVLILFLLTGLFVQAAPLDSIGVRKINGKTFIRHQVIKKETAFAISQRYKVHLDTLYALNPGMKSLKVGEIVLVPTANVEPIREQVDTRDQAHANADAVVNSPAMKHRVAPGETLNKIAQLYAVQVIDLQKWNNLKEGRIEPGQWLVVNAAAAIVPYKPWNRNKETIPDSINTLVLDPSVDEVTELGIARVVNQVKHARVKGLPEGGFVLISNVENSKQVIIKADKADGKSTEEGIIIYLSQDVANQLGGDRHGLMLVGLRYLIVQP
ncbi:MAG: LysM peptidoglycan-binding domain-containing protein [Bacteroidia bacterium]|jgi:LysM repeat protein